MVRANYGTGILSSVFGAKVFVMDKEIDTLPTTKPLEGGHETVRRLIDEGLPDLDRGLGRKTFAMGEYYMELFDRYPKVREYVRVYHPDLQGPMDLCELLWGSSLFLDVIDVPDLVKTFLDLITRTYIAFMKRWNEIVPPSDGYAPHWMMLHKGAIMLRDDSAMNFSPDMFEEFIEPYDQRLLDEFGGGGIHFCGRGDHYIGRATEMPGVYAINLSQPEYNKMEVIFDNTVDKGINIVGLACDAAEAALARGRDLHGRVHCW